MVTGADYQAATAGEQSFAALDGFFDKLRRTQIPKNETGVAYTMFLKAVAAGTNT
jgi:hypothetical protein